MPESDEGGNSDADTPLPKLAEDDFNYLVKRHNMQLTNVISCVVGALICSIFARLLCLPIASTLQTTVTGVLVLQNLVLGEHVQGLSHLLLHFSLLCQPVCPSYCINASLSRSCPSSLTQKNLTAFLQPEVSVHTFLLDAEQH
mgnify:FL=1